MVVRVQVEIAAVKGALSGTKIITSAVANAGYESDRPEAVIPSKLAKKLGFLPTLPDEARAEEYRAAGGHRTRGYSIPGGIQIQVITSDRKSSSVIAAVAIFRREQEVLLSDLLLDELGIVLERPGQGIWRFRDESKLRSSAPPEYW